MKQLLDLFYKLDLISTLVYSAETFAVDAAEHYGESNEKMSAAINLLYTLEQMVDEAKALADEVQGHRKVVDAISDSKHVREMEDKLASVKIEA